MTTSTLSSFLGGGFKGDEGEPGIGFFAPGVNDYVSANLTSDMVDSYTSTEESNFVLSILLTNKSGSDGTVSAEQYFAAANTTVKFAEQIPLNSGSTLELIKKPKILKDGDILRFRASSNNAVDAYLTFKSSTDVTYINSGVTLTGSSNTEVFVASSNTVIESIQISNIFNGVDYDVDVFLTNESNVITSYIARNMFIPSNCIVELNEQPKLLLAGHKIVAQADYGNIFSVVISGKEI